MTISMTRRIAAAAFVALSLSSVARADHPFILPSATAFSGDGNIVTFDAAGSDHVFFFDHRPIQLESISISKPDGTAGEPYNALQGRLRSVFDLRLDQPGTWKIASIQTMMTGTFKLNGEERRVGGRGGPPRAGQAGGPDGGGRDGGPRREGGNAATGSNGEPRRQPPVAFADIPADATDLHLTERVSRTETFVTQGAPTTTVFKPTGKGLELDPITHPNAIAAGETARFRFLIDGKPAPGLTVSVVPGGDRYREDPASMTLTTGTDGVVAIRWPNAGQFWVGAEATDGNATEKRAEARQMSYAATFEVMTP